MSYTVRVFYIHPPTTRIEELTKHLDAISVMDAISKTLDVIPGEARIVYLTARPEAPRPARPVIKLPVSGKPVVILN